jgi:hypothetical protein
MEKLYYILDTSTNTVVASDLTYQQSMEWLVTNGDPTNNILFEQDSI